MCYGVMLTRLIVNCRKRGIIVNVSSGIALSPSPLLGVYAATKVTDHMMRLDITSIFISLLDFYGLLYFSYSI